MNRTINMQMGALRRAYHAGQLKPTTVVNHILEQLDSGSQEAVWVSKASSDTMRARARALEDQTERFDELPLFGIPFSVKDNIDVAGEPTTAACPDFSYIAEQSAHVVEKVLAAGAIYVGKTNMDQFATGLVGVRSPYGTPVNPFNADYVPGGSSSGAAVSVSTGIVSFAFGTDTGGSGRVPASYNGIYGFKPAPGEWSSHGLVYACRSFDTASVFTRALPDALAVDHIVRGWDRRDPFSRDIARQEVVAPRIALLLPDTIETFGDGDVAVLYGEAHALLAGLYPDHANVDLSAFQSVNDLMFFGPFLAERDVSVGEFIDSHGDACHPVVRDLVLSSRKFSAADAYRAFYRLTQAKADTAAFWDRHDVLVTPTVGALFTRQDCMDDPMKPSFRNGYYTNFANPLGLAAIAVPFGRSPKNVPWGLNLYALPERQSALVAVAKILARSLSQSAMSRSMS